MIQVTEDDHVQNRTAKASVPSRIMRDTIGTPFQSPRIYRKIEKPRMTTCEIIAEILRGTVR